MHRTWHGSVSVGQNFSQVGTRASEVPSLESLPERAFAGKAILPLLAATRKAEAEFGAAFFN
jgi:hypothetical protein